MLIVDKVTTIKKLKYKDDDDAEDEYDVMQISLYL